MKINGWLLAGVAALVSCAQLEPASPPATTTLEGPIDGLSTGDLLRHSRGDAAFSDQIFTTASGLGPLFVAPSCAGCHAGDGKGHPFTTLIRFGQTDSTGNKFLSHGGPQLQNRAIPGYTPEALPAGAAFARFMPPINTGLGYLELVPDSALLAMADPFDLNHDGISGVPNYQQLPSYITPNEFSIPKGSKYICRFGKKASTYDLLHQTVNAYNQDIGITSSYDPIDTYRGQVVDAEVSAETINDVVLYLQTLKTPEQRNTGRPDVIQGRQLFVQIGCENCHREKLTTGYSPINSLSHQVFSPYTDLLLHDMGERLDDGYTEGSAHPNEWRTAPLWGLGLAPRSQGGNFFLLHDGRATSIEDAIQWHGGEASASVVEFNNASANERESLINFLKSL